MTQTSERSGSYPIESVQAQELERLRLQDDMWKY
jgi:hypothetical protein